MKKYLFLTLTLIIVAISVSACSGSRLSASGWSGLIADQDTAYLAVGPYIYAVNLNNGSLKWQYPSEPEKDMSFYAAPVLTEDGQLIVGGYNGVLYSFNPANGNLNWTYEGAESRYVGSPLVTPEGIFAPSADNHVYALNFEGQELWKPFPTDEPIWAQPSTTEDCGCIYVASMDHHIYALDAQTGNLMWKTEDLGGPIVNAPALDDHTLYVSTFANEVLAIDVETQGVLWRSETQDWAWANPLVDGEQLYVSDISGGFYALDIKTGEQLWQLQPGGEIVSAPLVIGEKVYFGTSEGSFIVTDRDGTIQQNNTLSGKLYTGPVAAEEIILVAPSEDEVLLIGYDPSGVKKWSFSTPEDK